MALNTENLARYRGANLVDQSGDKIGKIEEIYLDDRTGDPEWVLVNTGMFGTRSNFVPLRQASASGDDLTVPYDKAKVKDAPAMDADGHLSEDDERELYRYYEMDYESGSDTGTTDYDTTGTAGVATDYDTTTTTTTGDRDYATTGTTDYDTDRTVARDLSGPETDDAMTLSEERLDVGTQQREAGRARLRKYVVTENVTQTVPVSREEVRLEREPITDANIGDATSGPDLSEEEVEVTLREEVPVVDKQVVPTERVRVEKETVTGEQTVSEEVRREEADLDGDTTRTADTTPTTDRDRY